AVGVAAVDAVGGEAEHRARLGEVLLIDFDLEVVVGEGAAYGRDLHVLHGELDIGMAAVEFPGHGGVSPFVASAIIYSKHLIAHSRRMSSMRGQACALYWPCDREAPWRYVERQQLLPPLPTRRRTDWPPLDGDDRAQHVGRLRPVQRHPLAGTRALRSAAL